MSYAEAIFLGLVQGLGEFLPISSSAHLVVAPWFFDFKDPGLAFDVALHLGTLFAVLIYFWKDWYMMMRGSKSFFNGSRTETARGQMNLLTSLVIATIPGALAGFFLKDFAETSLRHPLLVAFNMFFLGLLLWRVDRHTPQLDNGKVDTVTLVQALVIGMSQALALFPGVSRSGITITTALLLGFGRKGAARFSFLLSTPIIFGACLLNIKHITELFASQEALVGIGVAALSGLISIHFLMRLVQGFSYRVFTYYRFLFAAVVVGVYFWRT